MLKLLDDIREHNQTQVTKYKEVFQQNKPPGALEATILILRMVHRFPPYRKANPHLPESFRDELRAIMTESCISRFQAFKHFTQPLDESDIESVVEGMTKLAELVSDEIEQDAKYFQSAFAQ